MEYWANPAHNHCHPWVVKDTGLHSELRAKTNKVSADAVAFRAHRSRLIKATSMSTAPRINTHGTTIGIHHSTTESVSRSPCRLPARALCRWTKMVTRHGQSAGRLSHDFGCSRQSMVHYATLVEDVFRLGDELDENSHHSTPNKRRLPSGVRKYLNAYGNGYEPILGREQ